MQSFQKNYSYQRYHRLPAPKQRRRLAYIKFFYLGVFVIFISLLSRSTFLNGDNQSGPSAVLAVSTIPEQVEKKPPPKRQVDTAGLQASLDQIIKQYPYDTSVSVIDLNSGKLIQTGDSYPFIAASTTKLLTSLLYLTRVENNQAKLSDNIGGKPANVQLEQAVNRSDNEAWQKLNAYLGKESLASYANSHQITSYDPIRNTITSNDMASILAKLYNRELLNDEHTKLLLSWMQNTSEERFIPAAVTAETAVYHKAGYLPERVHDVAIIDNGSAPFVIVIYSKSYSATYDYSLGRKLFAQITQHTLATFK